ncbi:hypothetical protein AB3332_23045 [Ralstonia solanacearum]|uniref:hypothetical protein n=1 Tax=Ralstonia solanacearum TaxID=305 RepID=UPI0034DD235D
MTSDMWVFRDPPNVAVIATRSVVFEQDWIAHVSHDLEDGAWQFRGSQTMQTQESEAVVVSLRKIVELDSTVKELANLPLGWHAWRAAEGASWNRAMTDA